MTSEQGDASHGHVRADERRHDDSDDVLKEAGDNDSADAAGTNNTPVSHAASDHGSLSDEHTDGSTSGTGNDGDTDILALDEARANAETDDERSTKRSVQHPVGGIFLLRVDDGEGTVGEGERNGQTAEQEDDSVDSMLAEESESNTGNDESGTDRNVVAIDELGDAGLGDLGAAALGAILQLDHALLLVERRLDELHVGAALVAVERHLHELLLVFVRNALGALDSVGERKATVSGRAGSAVGLLGDLSGLDFIIVEDRASGALDVVSVRVSIEFGVLANCLDLGEVLRAELILAKIENHRLTLGHLNSFLMSRPIVKDNRLALISLVFN